MKKYDEKKKKDSDKSDSGIKAQGPGAHVELDFYIGHKKTGSDTSLKWHVYLGQPDPDKRCTFTLIDFETKIVTVAVGANAYLCVGNELPNNGNLPPIPVKIRNFLNGSSSGTYESDDVSKADKARNEAKTRFMSNAATGGGVMMGAAVWGYIKVDLGLFYGDMGAEAGFDLSIRKLGPERCINLKGGTPGHNDGMAKASSMPIFMQSSAYVSSLDSSTRRLTSLTQVWVASSDVVCPIPTISPAKPV